MIKSKTKAEKEHMSRVAALGCLICGMPPELHHVRTGQGLGQRAPHMNVIPLCHIHHRTGNHGQAFHAGKQTWQERFGTEEQLLARVNKLLEVLP